MGIPCLPVQPNASSSFKSSIIINMKSFICTILLVAATTHSAPSSSDSSNTRFFGGNRPVGGFNTGISGGLVGGGNHVIGGVSPPIVGPGPVVGPGGPGSVCSFFCRRGGRYVCCENSQQANPGSCPIPRPQCPPVRSGFGGPQPCNLDIDCPTLNKCCHDTCLGERVCKAAIYG